jgi:hypothetical protein
VGELVVRVTLSEKVESADGGRYRCQQKSFFPPFLRQTKKEGIKMARLKFDSWCNDITQILGRSPRSVGLLGKFMAY